MDSPRNGDLLIGMKLQPGVGPNLSHRLRIQLMQGLNHFVSVLQWYLHVVRIAG